MQETARRIVHGDPEIMSGEPVFVGTRVPVKNLFDYLEAGDSLDDFLNSFPSVTKEQAIAALAIAKRVELERHVLDAKLGQQLRAERQQFDIRRRLGCDSRRLGRIGLGQWFLLRRLKHRRRLARGSRGLGAEGGCPLRSEIS